MPDYEYLPLGSNEIRRLVLFPGEFEDPLEARVVHDVFEPPQTVPQYEALSYVWGSQETPETLTVFGDTVCDGSPDRSSLREVGSIPLGRNLASALRHLRRKAETRVIWCDAVCINQRDVGERSVQVQRMKDIYPVSERVVAWLGPGSEETRRAMQIISQTKWNAVYNYTTKEWLIDEHPDGNAGETYLYAGSFSQQDWQSIYLFLGLPWFKRLWVRQEIVLANDSSIFMTGTDVVDLITFNKAMHTLYRITWLERVLVEEDARANCFDRLVGVWILLASRKSLTRSFEEVWIGARSCECSDPRDRIYGVLGICESLDINPDYTKSTGDVYLDVVQALMKKYRTDSCVYLSSCTAGETPSWVPNFDKPGFYPGRGFTAIPGALLDLEILPHGKATTWAIPCGTIERRTPTIGRGRVRSILRDTIRNWITALLPGKFERTDSRMIDEIVITIMLGGMADFSYDSVTTLSEARDILFQDIDGYTPEQPIDQETYSRVYSRLCLNLPNSSLLETDDGHFGLGSGAACEGDEIFAVPGCRDPLILRPFGDSGCYKIAGPCFMSSLMWSEAAWGPLPEGWKAKKLSDDLGYEFTDPDGRTTDRDPRRGPLPPGWHEAIHSDGKPAWYKLGDEEAKEDSWARTDPRLTPERLRARGVKVETLTLI